MGVSVQVVVGGALEEHHRQGTSREHTVHLEVNSLVQTPRVRWLGLVHQTVGRARVGLGHGGDLALDGAVEPVLDGVVSPPVQTLADQRPLIAVLHVQGHDQLVLLGVPLGFVDARVQVVEPSLPTLLPDPAVELVRDLGPLVRPVLPYQVGQQGVFLLCPGPFHPAFFLTGRFFPYYLWKPVPSKKLRPH